MSTATFALKVWKLADLVASPLNARSGIETDPDTIALAASIRQDGVMHDPLVTSDGRIICGRRRIVAAGLAGLKTIQCKTYDKGLSASAEHVLRIRENWLRKDLSPIERAKELKALVDMQPGKAKQKAACAQLGITESVMSRSLALLDLPDTWQNAVHTGRVDPAHTRCVIAAGKLHPSLPEKLHNLLTVLPPHIPHKEWEQEVAEYIPRFYRPVAPKGAKKPEARFAMYSKELDIRDVGGQLAAFNVDLWESISKKDTQEEQPEEEQPQPEAKPLPHIDSRRKIVIGWFNRRFLEIFQKSPAAHIRWLPVLDIPSKGCHAAIAGALGGAFVIKEPGLEPVAAIEAIGKKIKGNQATTFLANYLKEACAIALAGQATLIRDWQQCIAMAQALTVDYVSEFAATLSNNEAAELADLYGEAFRPGKLPKGMDAKSLGIRRA